MALNDTEEQQKASAFAKYGRYHFKAVRKVSDEEFLQAELYGDDFGKICDEAERFLQQCHVHIVEFNNKEVLAHQGKLHDIDLQVQRKNNELRQLEQDTETAREEALDEKAKLTRDIKAAQDEFAKLTKKLDARKRA